MNDSPGSSNRWMDTGGVAERERLVLRRPESRISISSIFIVKRYPRVAISAAASPSPRSRRWLQSSAHSTPRPLHPFQMPKWSTGRLVNAVFLWPQIITVMALILFLCKRGSSVSETVKKGYVLFCAVVVVVVAGHFLWPRPSTTTLSYSPRRAIAPISAGQ